MPRAAQQMQAAERAWIDSSYGQEARERAVVLAAAGKWPRADAAVD
jgi:hypothetical protein